VVTESMQALYVSVLHRGITSHPRSLQKHIGPSEIGIECDKRILYKLAGVGEPPRVPAWKPVIGTAVHALLQEWFDAANSEDRHEWVTENTVGVAEVGDMQISGSCDLFHIPTGTVIDHKVVGTKQLQNYRANGPSQQYRVQAHLYGLGFANAGDWGAPETVAIAFLPRDGELSRMFFWSEPWSKQVADDALNRLRRLDRLWRLVGIEKAVEVSPGCVCPWCPWCTTRSQQSTNLFHLPAPWRTHT
jgi:hypothetical protein